MGVIGILPYIADHFHISVSKAGWLVSLFALTVAMSGPTMPLLFSGINRKKAMLLVLGIFVLGNIVSIFASNFAIAIIARVIPAIFHPIYCSLAFTVAANRLVKKKLQKLFLKYLWEYLQVWYLVYQSQVFWPAQFHLKWRWYFLLL